MKTSNYFASMTTFFKQQPQTQRSCSRWLKKRILQGNKYIYTRTHRSMYVFMYACMYKYVGTYTYIDAYIYLYTHTYILWTCICVCVCMHNCQYKQKYIHKLNIYNVCIYRATTYTHKWNVTEWPRLGFIWLWCLTDPMSSTCPFRYVRSYRLFLD